MVDFLKRLRRDTRGATAVEYGLILALIFLAMIGAMQSLSTETVGMWSKVETAVVQAAAT